MIRRKMHSLCGNFIPQFRPSFRSCLLQPPGARIRVCGAFAESVTLPFLVPAHTLRTFATETISDDLLHFEERANFSGMTQHARIPFANRVSESKVILEVNMRDLDLDPNAERRFLRMVGTRFNAGKQKVKFVANIFPSRVENRRHLVNILERLLHVAKRTK